jgi:hypothetical protein
MPYLEENEWMILNELAYNISFIYSVDAMRKDVLNWLNLLINFDGAVFSLFDAAGNARVQLLQSLPLSADKINFDVL